MSYEEAVAYLDSLGIDAMKDEWQKPEYKEMPLVATGRTTRTAVCHGVAPAPSEALRRELGTLERASSETV